MSAHQKDPVWNAFCAAIPEQSRDDVMCMIAEAAQGIDHDEIMILERDRLDAINVRAEGILEFGGEEYTFLVEDGNWNGTDLQDWNGGKKFTPYHRTVWALQPRSDLIADAIVKGQGPFLVKKWDIIAARPEVARIPSSYSYDRMMQPGGKIEKYWKAEAAKFQFVLVSEEEASETRQRLLAAGKE